MEKYFSSTTQSAIITNKPFSSFSSMIGVSPKLKSKEQITSQKSIQ